MKKFFGLLFLSLAPALHAAETTLNAPYTDTDINSAITAATAGDTIWLEDHTVNVTTKITVDKAIALRAINRGSVTFQDSISPRNTFFQLDATSTSGTYWVDGIVFENGTATSNASICVRLKGTDNVGGTNSNWRVSYCTFDKLKGRIIGFYAWTGLFDHNTITLGTSSGVAFDGRVTNTTVNKGHESWAGTIDYGTKDEGVYFEYNTVSSDAGGTLRAGTDGFAGARYVVRYNTFNNRAIENHGTESTQEFRGTRWMAAYGNTMNATGSGENAVHYRSGSGVVFDNVVTGTYPGLLRMINDRYHGGWKAYGPADGRSLWDLNGLEVDSGTATGGGSNSLVDTGGGWSTNQFVGYEVLHETTGNWGRVTSNTSTTITMQTVTGTPVTFSSSDPYSIRQVVFATGTAAAGSGTSFLQVSGTPFSTNEFAGTGYILRHVVNGTVGSATSTTLTDTGAFTGLNLGGYYVTDLDTGARGKVTSYNSNTVTFDNNSGQPSFSPGDPYEISNGAPILSNTTNTITAMSNSGLGSSVFDLTLASGYTFDVRRVELALDQPGAGETAILLEGGGQSDGYVPDPVRNLLQAVEPIYYWNNTGTVTGAGNTSLTGIVAGTHYINSAHPTYTALGVHPNYALTEGSGNPIISSGTIGTDGVTVTVTVTEAAVFGAGGSGGFIADMSAGPTALTYSSGTGTTSLVFTAARTINSDETGNLDYTQPGNGWEADDDAFDIPTTLNATLTNGSMQGASVPDPPTNFAQSGPGRLDEVDVTWTDNDDTPDETSFSIERLIVGQWTIVATPAANATSATIFQLPPNTSGILLRIQAINASGSSAYDGPIEISTAFGGSAPGPQGGRVRGAGGGLGIGL